MSTDENDALFRKMRSELESSPLSEVEMARLCTRWLKMLRTTTKRVTLRALAREIARARDEAGESSNG